MRRFCPSAAMILCVALAVWTAGATVAVAQVADGAAADITVDDKREGRVVAVDVTPAEPDLAARARLSTEARATADASPLPLVLPADDALLASAVVTSGDGWIAASMQADGLHIAVHGLALAVEHPGLLAEVGGAFDEVRVAHSHAIWTVSFEAHGMAWALDVECATGPQDDRCTSPSAARALAATMVAVSTGGQ